MKVRITSSSFNVADVESPLFMLLRHWRYWRLGTGGSNPPLSAKLSLRSVILIEIIIAFLLFRSDRAPPIVIPPVLLPAPLRPLPHNVYPNLLQGS